MSDVNESPDVKIADDGGENPDGAVKHDPKAQGVPEQKKDEAPEIYRPEGIPDHYLGASDHETIDKLYKTADGLRKELSQKKGVPEKFEDYTIELSDEDREKYLSLNDDGVDPVYETLRKTAFEQGIPPAAALKFVENLYAQVHDGANEAAAALKETVDHGYESFGGPEKAKPVVDAVESWITGLQTQGVINEDDAAEMRISSSYGEGLRWLDKIRVSTGEKPIPADFKNDSNAGALTKAELDAMMQDPKYWRQKDPAFIAKVTEGFRQLYGKNAA